MARRKKKLDIYPVETRRTEAAVEALECFCSMLEAGNIKGIFAISLGEDGSVKYVSTMQHGDAMLVLRHAEQVVLSESLS